MRLGPLLILAWCGFSLVTLIATFVLGFQRGRSGVALGFLMFLGSLLSGAFLLAWITAMESPTLVGSPMFIAEIIVGSAGVVLFILGTMVLGREP